MNKYDLNKLPEELLIFLIHRLPKDITLNDIDRVAYEISKIIYHEWEDKGGKV